MTTFTEISVGTDGEAAEAVAEVLRPFAYQNSVVLEQQGDADSLDPMAVEPAVTVKIFVPEDEDTPGLRRRIEEILYHMNRLYPVPRAPISRSWKKRIGRMPGKRITILSAWENESGSGRPGMEMTRRRNLGMKAGPADIILVMDPGMAFGTGLHPTTQSCLQRSGGHRAPGGCPCSMLERDRYSGHCRGKIGAARTLRPLIRMNRPLNPRSRNSVSTR